MALAIVLILTLFHVGVSAAEATIAQTDSDEWLSVHNQHRANQQAANMQTMVWSQTLADLATDYALKCKWDHRPSAERKNVGEFSYVGENLAASTGQRSVEGVMKQWMDEIEFYNYDANSCQDGEQCGHYTQVVWAKSCAVGCAMAFCPNFEAFNRDAYYTVCNYGPGGNFNGEKPFVTGSGGLQESKCQADAGGGVTSATTSSEATAEPSATPSPATPSEATAEPTFTVVFPTSFATPTVETEDTPPPTGEPTFTIIIPTSIAAPTSETEDPLSPTTEQPTESPPSTPEPTFTIIIPTSIAAPTSETEDPLSPTTEQPTESPTTRESTQPPTEPPTTRESTRPPTRYTRSPHRPPYRYTRRPHRPGKRGRRQQRKCIGRCRQAARHGSYRATQRCFKRCAMMTSKPTRSYKRPKNRRHHRRG